jgi:hypothetical protein
VNALPSFNKTHISEMTSEISTFSRDREIDKDSYRVIGQRVEQGIERATDDTVLVIIVV